MSFTNLDLDVSNYSLDDLLSLFQISSDLTEDEMKHAKKMVHMTHPDKSKQPKELFIFFCSAYRMLHAVYKFRGQVNKDGCVSTQYDSGHGEKEQPLIDFANHDEFNKRFNELFEKHKSEYDSNDGHGDWLGKEIEETMASTRDEMEEAIAERKKNLRALVVRDKVECLYEGMGASTLDEEGGFYGSSGNGGLHYDDVRHAYTETVVPVTEEDLRVEYRSVDELQRERKSTLIGALENSDHEALRRQAEKEEGDSSMRRAYRLARDDEKMRKANDEWRSNLLRLTHN
jgi:hypothetical protein